MTPTTPPGSATPGPDAPGPDAADLKVLLPMGGVVMTAGDPGEAWRAALGDGGHAADRVIAIPAEIAASKGLDDVAEQEKLLDLHLLIVGPDAEAGRVLAHAGRLIGIFEPVIAILGDQSLHDSLLEELGYDRRPLPSGLLTLLPTDDAD